MIIVNIWLNLFNGQFPPLQPIGLIYRLLFNVVSFYLSSLFVIHRLFQTYLVVSS